MTELGTDSTDEEREFIAANVKHLYGQLKDVDPILWETVREDK